MECREVREHLLDLQAGRLRSDLEGALRAHLAACGPCSRLDAEERALTEVLESRLPQYPAPRTLKRRLAAQWPEASRPQRSRVSRWAASLAPAFAVAIVLLVAIPLSYRETGTPGGSEGAARMVDEAVNDYLRLLTSQRPLEIESGGIHQVKPWFEGRLDFAPVIGFDGDQDFPLRGGAVGYFLDRKAAVFVFGRRLHTISLFVFRAEGLPWQSRGLEPMGKAQAYVTMSRGFNVILWRAGEMGYALVSDLDGRELLTLGTKLAGGA